MIVNFTTKLTSKVIPILLILATPTSVIAANCPFDETKPQPNWVLNIGNTDDHVVGIGIEQYQPDLHASIFDLRKLSEQKAREVMATQLESAVYNELLVNKELKNNKLVTKARSTVEQVTELTLPEVLASGRWLDKQTCMYWTRVEVGKNTVEEYVDEIGSMEVNVVTELDNSLTQSNLEVLNSKQFYLNYAGFAKAVNQQATLDISGEHKNVLSWMLNEGLNMLEPALGEVGFYSKGLFLTHNLSPLIQYLLTESPSIDKVGYILDSIDQSGLDLNRLVTGVQMNAYGMNQINYANSGSYFGYFGQGGSMFGYGTLSYALGNSIASTQDKGRLNTVKKYQSRTNFEIGQWTLLHVATLARRSDWVELLLNRGMDPNTPDVTGMTPAQYAIAIEDENVIKIYLESGKRLDGIYRTAVQTAVVKSIYDATTHRTSMYLTLNLDESDVSKLKAKIIKVNNGSITSDKAFLKQNLASLKVYYSMLDDNEISEERKENNLQRLESLL